MNFTIGVYDLFTYAIPGALYTAVFLYVGHRAEWVNAKTLDGLPVSQILVSILVCYLVGHITFAVRRSVRGVIWPQRDRLGEYRDLFRTRCPEAATRPYVEFDLGVLRAAIETRDKESAAEVTRLNAVALMLRGVAPALLVAAVVAGVEVFFMRKPEAAGAAAAVLLVSSIAAAIQGMSFYQWSVMKTLELAYWVPGIDSSSSSSD